MKVIIAALSLMALAGCAMPARSSKLEYYTGGPGLNVPEEKILEDIARSSNMKKKGPLTGEQLKFKNEKGYNEVSTTTDVKIYPYTEPLLAARITKTVSETGFKAQWSDAKVQSEIKTELAKETARLVKGKQCFAMEIETTNPEAIDLKYWNGQVAVNGKKQNLTFAKSKGYVVPTAFAVATQARATAGVTTAPIDNKYLNFVDVCTTNKIDLLEGFTVNLEPRFELGALPSEITWKKPYAAKTL